MCWVELCKLPAALAERASMSERAGFRKKAAYLRQLALIFGLYTMTCPVRGKELYNLRKPDVKVTHSKLTVTFKDYKNSASQGEKWKVLPRQEGFGFLIDLAKKVLSASDRRLLCSGRTKPDNTVFVTITGKPYSGSHWSTTVKKTISKFCPKLRRWSIGVNGIRKAFVTKLLAGSPSSAILKSVACAMNTSVDELYATYDQRCSCERSKAGIQESLRIFAGF